MQLRGVRARGGNELARRLLWGHASRAQDAENGQSPQAADKKIQKEQVQMVQEDPCKGVASGLRSVLSVWEDRSTRPEAAERLFKLVVDKVQIRQSNDLWGHEFEV